jgi:flagellar biosynthesis component FlhA
LFSFLLTQKLSSQEKKKQTRSSQEKLAATIEKHKKKEQASLKSAAKRVQCPQAEIVAKENAIMQAAAIAKVTEKIKREITKKEALDLGWVKPEVKSRSETWNYYK